MKHATQRLEFICRSPTTAICCGMELPKKKPAAAKFRSWRISILRGCAQNLGTIEAPDATAAEAQAVMVFGLTEGQRQTPIGVGAQMTGPATRCYPAKAP